MKYVKKLVLVDAVQWTGGLECLAIVPFSTLFGDAAPPLGYADMPLYVSPKKSVEEAVTVDAPPATSDKRLFIRTAKGVPLVCNPGDWVLLTNEGRLFPLSDADFHRQYDACSE